MNCAADGLARDDYPRAAPEARAKPGEVFIGELVENEIAQDEIVLIETGKGKQVFAAPAPSLGPAIGAGPQVQPVNLNLVGKPTAFEKPPSETAVAGAEFEPGLAAANVLGQDPLEPAEVAHQEVDQSQVTAVVNGFGMIFGKRVQDLRLNFSLELAAHTLVFEGCRAPAGGTCRGVRPIFELPFSLRVVRCIDIFEFHTMRKHLFPLLSIPAALVLFAAVPVAAETTASDDSVLPRGVVAVVKTGSLKELSEKIVDIARQIEPGPQVESMPFMLGAMIGDPMLQGVEAGRNIGMAFVKYEGDYHPVLLAKLSESSPYRQSLQGYGLRLADHEGWTFGTMGEMDPAAVENLRDPLLEWVQIPRTHDIEVELNGPEISRFVLEREDEIRAAIREGTGMNGAGHEDAVWAVLRTLAGEFRVLSSVGFAIGLESDKITQRAYLGAAADTALGRFLSADHTASTGIVDWIGFDHPMVYVGRANPGAILDYVDYFSNKTVVSEGEILEGALQAIRELIALYSEYSDGNAAGAVRFEGMSARTVQVSESRFDDEALRESLRLTASMMSLSQGMVQGLTGGSPFGDATTETEVVEAEEGIGDYPVHILRTRMEYGKDDEEMSEEQRAFFQQMQEQLVYYVQVKDYLVTASHLEDSRGVVNAIDAGERPVGREGDGFREEPGLAGQWIINPSLLSGAVQGFLPGAGTTDLDLPPIRGEVSMKENGARAQMEIPVALIAGLVREARAGATGFGEGAVEFEDEDEAED